jgi:S-adenosylmethionine:tRNA ribosyltransferase-isomerase
MSSALAFALPSALEAHEPPEARGLRRDAVRLMVATSHDGRIAHTRFDQLPRFLRAGDLLVVNDSATMPAALSAKRAGGEELELHLSTPAGDRWLVELRRDGAPYACARTGERIELPAGAAATLLAPYAGAARLWLAEFDLPEPLADYLERHGRPIRYSYVPREWPLAYYQTVYARGPGSAEMPSAGRPFTHELLARLRASGVGVAALTLHTGVSSPERHEPPYPERYRVPAATARRVNDARERGGRVIAVGTTVVRALETQADAAGRVAPGAGWTRLVLGPERGLRAVDGLITGWHEPDASHLELLRAAAPQQLLVRCYGEALARGYLWHEFGDSHLLLP